MFFDYIALPILNVKVIPCSFTTKTKFLHNFNLLGVKKEVTKA